VYNQNKIYVFFLEVSHKFSGSQKVVNYLNDQFKSADSFEETAETATPANTPVESEWRRRSPPEEDVWLRAAAVHRSYGVRDADGGRGLARPR